ncbi:hypothetical protein [Yoonia sp. SS1-5]|uniref:CHAT domain-containing protein n=1 Tax=Yoonia rhodophyticola TaxID=3137370 RepID=A0AAN0MD00_9RHOB
MKLSEFQSADAGSFSRVAGIAMAGVLTAAIRQYPDFSRADLEWLSQEVDRGYLRWAPPFDTDFSAFDCVFPNDLANLWQDHFVQSDMSGRYRLLIDLSDIEAVSRMHDMRDVLDLFADIDPFQPFGIGAIHIAVPGSAKSVAWQWPPRIAMPDNAVLDAQSGSYGMFARGLAKAVSMDDAADIAIHTDGWPMLRNGNLKIWATGDAGFRRSTLDGAARMVANTGCAVAIWHSDLPEIPTLADNLTRELCHDLAPDLALTFAHRQLRQAGLWLPLVLLVPESGFARQNENGRISARFRDLLDDLEKLPTDMPLGDVPAGIFEHLPGATPPRSIGGLRVLLRFALRNPEETFQYERDGASAYEGLREKTTALARGDAGQEDAGPADFFAPSDIPDDFGIGEPEAMPYFEPEPVASPARDFLPPSPSAPPAAPQDDRFIARDRPPDAAETDRFLDVTLFPDHLVAATSPAHQVAQDAVLDPHSPYTLEVAIRARRTGISAAMPMAAVLNPRQDVEPLTVWVRVETSTPDLFDFSSQLRRITWLANADSDSALIHLSTREASMGREGKLEVRLLSDSLELLALVELRGIKIREPSTLELQTPLGAPTRLDPALIGQPRTLNLHFRPDANGYTMDAIWRRDGKTLEGVPLGRTVLMEELQSLNADIRAYWAKAALGVLENRESATEQTLQRMLDQVTIYGERAWRVLFGTQSPDHGDTAAALGGMLADAVDSPDQLIQITYKSGAQGFVFPWALLRPPRKRGEAADWSALWGLKHRVEQIMGVKQPDGLATSPVSVATAQDPNFAQTGPHFDTLAKIAQQHGVALNAPFDSVDALKEALNAATPAHLFYFFCHGYTPSPAHLPRDVEKAFKASDDYAFLGLGERPDMAAISFGGGRITEHELAALHAFDVPRPVFFLNMCQSAEAAPGRSDGLLLRLLDRGAAAVIGTECEMTATFASAFGEHVLDAILGGEDLGSAMLSARRYFQKSGNPLGLAYSLYGQAETRVGPPKSPPPDIFQGDMHEH